MQHLGPGRNLQQDVRRRGDHAVAGVDGIDGIRLIDGVQLGDRYVRRQLGADLLGRQIEAVGQRRIDENSSGCLATNTWASRR